MYLTYAFFLATIVPVLTIRRPHSQRSFNESEKPLGLRWFGKRDLTNERGSTAIALKRSH